MSSNNAGGFASNLMKRASDKLTSLIPSSILPSSSSNAPEPDAAIEDLRRLESTMKRIQAIVSDAEQRGIKGRAEKLRLEELKEVAYDADDVVDEYEFEVLSAKLESGIQLGGDNHNRKRGDEVCQVMISSHIIVPVPNELAIRVKRVRERFDDITSGWKALCFGEGEILGGSNVDMFQLPPSSSLVNERSIHGRDDDKKNIIESFILDNSNSNGDGSLSVLPLVGMGGIGKTTLAQLIYNDPRVCEYYHLRAWVCVSEDFSVKTLTKNIIVSFNKKTCDFTELDDLQRTLMDIVKGKRFLIILDDVWNEQPNLWHLLKIALNDAGIGKIIVTTRSEKVASMMGTRHSHFLTDLPFEYCWSLFKQVLFENRDPNLNYNLLEIGKKLVMKCKGLPLAVKALGSLLRFEDDDENNWGEILESEIWENNEVLPALKISYDRLPIHLKHCFVFFSLFPKDYVIPEDKIVRLWLSLDLVDPQGRKSLEDTCVGYVTELMQRSMLQLTDGKKRFFIMHDLVNDLAQFVSGKDFARIRPDRLDDLPCGVRYLSIVSNDPTDIIDMQYVNNLKAPRLLQIVYTMADYFSEKIVKIPLELFEMLRHLRALDFSCSTIDILPESIGNLKQLRSLNLRNTNVKKLPDSICGLYNLQTLDLEDSYITELPFKIGRLVNLRHLGISHNMCIPSGIGNLLNLKILPIFNIRPGTWHCALSELKDLLNLENELNIYGLEYVIGMESVKEVYNSLCNKKDLKSLSMYWPTMSQKPCSHSTRKVDDSDKYSIELLGALKPHINIEDLCIGSYPGSSFPKWLGDASFSKLITFTFTNGSVSNLPTLGQLPSLRSVYIHNMKNLKNVGREFCSLDSDVVCFRSLNTLELSNMYEWENWSGVEKNDFSSLQTLKIANCMKLKFIPEPLCSSLSTFTTLELINCMKLKFIPEPLCSSLSTLTVSNCETLITPRLLPSLNCLIIYHGVSAVFFDGLHLPLLKTLKLKYVKSITSLVLTSQNLPMIGSIKIVECSNLRDITGLGSLSSLTKLKLDSCSGLQFANDELLPHELKQLDIFSCPQLDSWYKLQNKRGMKASFEWPLCHLGKSPR